MLSIHTLFELTWTPKQKSWNKKAAHEGNYSQIADNLRTKAIGSSKSKIFLKAADKIENRKPTFLQKIQRSLGNELKSNKFTHTIEPKKQQTSTHTGRSVLPKLYFGAYAT